MFLNLLKEEYLKGSYRFSLPTCHCLLVFVYTSTAFFSSRVFGGHAAEAFIAPDFDLPRLFLDVGDDGPGQPAHKAAGQENLNGQQIPMCRQEQSQDDEGSRDERFIHKSMHLPVNVHKKP